MSKDYYFPDDTPYVGERWDFSKPRSSDQKYHHSASVRERAPYKLTVITQKYNRKGKVYAEKVDEVYLSTKTSAVQALKQLGFSSPGSRSKLSPTTLDEELFRGNVVFSPKGMERRGLNGKYYTARRFGFPKKRRGK